MEKKEDREPFVFEVVAEAELAVEMGKLGRAEAGGFRDRGEGEIEGLVLP